VLRGKLIIVEDQTIFRKGLRNLIESEDWGWTITGEASNGEEALELIKANRPDLVLTDIRMPHMDGLQLAGQIQRLWPDILVVILTAYKDFEYAQAALRLGVKDFLVKPCDEEKVEEVLHRAYDHLLKKAAERDKEASVKRFAWEHDFRSLLLRMPSAASLSDFREDCRGKEIWLIKVVEFFPAVKGYRTEDLELLQFALSNIIFEILEINDITGSLVPIEQDEYALLLTEWVAPDRLMKEMEDALNKFLGIPVFVFRYGAVQQTSCLPLVYDRFKALCQDYGYSVTSVQSNKSREQKEAYSHADKVKRWKTRLTLHILHGQTRQLVDDVESFMTDLLSLDVHDAKLEAFSFALALQEILRQEFSVKDEAGLAERFDQVHNLQTLSKINEWLRERLDRFMRTYMDKDDKKCGSHVQKAIHYIESHYTESCTLSDAAGVLHLAEPYLSKIFKKETGETFVNYVTKIRMEKSRLLLANTDMKIFEIASTVGYDDPNYFTAVFSSTQHMSPREFRKQKEHDTNSR
jgi:two-component system, response regulator YesN